MVDLLEVVGLKLHPLEEAESAVAHLQSGGIGEEPSRLTHYRVVAKLDEDSGQARHTVARQANETVGLEQQE